MLLPSFSVAQNNSAEIAPSWIPRPMVFGGLPLYDHGYRTVAGNIGGGLLLNHNKLIGDFAAFYSNVAAFLDFDFGWRF